MSLDDQRLGFAAEDVNDPCIGAGRLGGVPLVESIASTRVLRAWSFSPFWCCAMARIRRGLGPMMEAASLFISLMASSNRPWRYRAKPCVNRKYG